MGRVTSRRKILRLDGGAATRRTDTLAAEEPLDIRVGGRTLTVTMRTPGDDFDLVAGFLVAEGVVHETRDLAALRYCAGTDDEGRNTYNVVDAALAAHVPPLAPGLQRGVWTSSSCGICGTTGIDGLRKISRFDVASDEVRLPPEALFALPGELRRAQKVFDSTGGLHAAGLFTPGGEAVCVREDVGRHNAVDKVVGWALREGRLPLAGHVLAVSGRASFELTQKAIMAGIPVLAAVSAPSSLAVELAEDAGVTLVGFLRGASANVYTHADRVTG
ncbi:formate dehydrogenase accessory sulfurtransferase FdhD [Yinghuangia sp. ASG 101]|uniref:formate dehydrogenase accessory sulfurtransferase FdhD n=1 Tax=Yinghuangia sp. ASG 101 TaxID=2896848 RepID=UPI001E53CEF9|nr:formate dehydrogenase accessory sulfurtransferase FdhD [Yinghuangia sp. ASG 101]UGQ14431.1 formate dehydrogenase accessory sulfurtransferase FdhD [Yinghuangia sp. ASG 101]